MLIGRDAKCDIRITDDPEVSARHAMIVVRAGATELVASIMLTPLSGSTLVNGKVVSNETQTKLGDTIQLGNTILKFRPDSAAAQASSPKIELPAPPPQPQPALRPAPMPPGNPPAPHAQPRPISPPP